jgi:CRISPR-associated protein Cmr4
MTRKIYQPLVFRLHALTNLHPGSGDSFYGAVDKLVQRDPVTRRPTIYSHSLKGALREYFETQLGYENGTPEEKAFVTHVFGSSVKGNPDDAAQGNFRFFSADLLAFPVPDEDPNSTTAFHLKTDEEVWKHFTQKINLLHLNGKWEQDALKQEFNKDLSGFSNDAAAFKNACDELPVIARNQLENGESQNLWYEELVPHQSVFGFIVQVEKSEENMAKIAEFTQKLNNQVVQIGANATVGYGYCLITQIKSGS